LTTDKIRLMISSRSNAEVFSPPITLKKLRRSFKKHIVENLKISTADGIQRIQMLFLANCRDVTSTRSAITEMFQWLEQSDQEKDVVRRAISRKKILAVIEREMNLL